MRIYSDSKERYFHIYHNIGKESGERALLAKKLRQMKTYMMRHTNEVINFGGGKINAKRKKKRQYIRNTRTADSKRTGKSQRSYDDIMKYINKESNKDIE